MTATTQETVLSGIRATGRLHFGNFMGAVRHFVTYQESEHRCMYFIADLHTLTTFKNREELHGNVLEIAKDYLAAGLDPERSIIYAQSSVPAISELSLLLSMLQPHAELQHLPTVKDMMLKYPDNVNLGLVTYPVLMAADIIGPQATIVPVGEDQVPNLELTRKLVRRVNRRLGTEFPEPRALAEMVKVPGLDGNKMGKSEADNAIDINAPIEEIRRRYYTRGLTDPQRLHATDPGDPYNRCKSVYPLHEMITADEKSSRRIAEECRAGTISCKACKALLVDSIAGILEPFQARRAELAHKDDYVRDILHEGGRRAREIISKTLEEVRDKMGIVVY